MAYTCYAPVFRANNFFACVILQLIYTMVIILLIIGTFFLILLFESGRCTIRKYRFRMKYCTKGNDNPNLEI